MGLVNTVVPLDAARGRDRRRGAARCSQLSPFALRLLKAGFNADEDGLAGIQQLAHDANLLFYATGGGAGGPRRLQGEAHARTSRSSRSGREPTHLGHGGAAADAARSHRSRAGRHGAGRPARAASSGARRVHRGAARRVLDPGRRRTTPTTTPTAPRHRRRRPPRAGAAWSARGLVAAEAVKRAALAIVRRGRGRGAGARSRSRLELLRRRRRVVRWPAVSTRAARGPTATPGSERCSCSCSSASWRSPARRSRMPERVHVDDEVLDDRQVPHRRDHGHVPRLRDVVHARLAREHRRAVHAHAAGAADHHPAALAVGERAVVLVLDDVEAVEERRLLGRVDLVLLQLALAGTRVEPPDLETDLHPLVLPLHRLVLRDSDVLRRSSSGPPCDPARDRVLHEVLVVALGIVVRAARARRGSPCGRPRPAACTRRARSCCRARSPGSGRC